MREDITSPGAICPRTARRDVEWLTLGLLAGVHLGWALILIYGGVLPPWLALALLGPLLTLHSSLQHEVLHGHPFADTRLNEATVALPLGLAIPYRRFRDQHLADHHDPNLTDPYDDPEANYVDPAEWVRMCPLHRLILRAHNTLLGRMTLAPMLRTWAMWQGDLAAGRAGDRTEIRAWALHGLGAVPVLLAIAASGVSICTYLGGVWLALAILRIRTFLERRAEIRPRNRSVIIEDPGPLAWLFLNNNLHALHHARTGLPWYALPRAYAAEREDVLRRNGQYRYDSYAQILAQHLLRAKDPVPHPFLTWSNRTSARQDAEALLAGVLPDAAPRPAPARARAR